MLSTLFLAIAAIPAILATPVALEAAAAPVALDARAAEAACVDYCGSQCYWQEDITAALNKGYSLYKSGKTLGSSAYPHTYYDDEGFSFMTAGPYQEFPILNSFAVYSGGSPGADRIVFQTTTGKLAGLITHTGASGNNFEQCRLA